MCNQCKKMNPSRIVDNKCLGCGATMKENAATSNGDGPSFSFAAIAPSTATTTTGGFSFGLPGTTGGFSFGHPDGMDGRGAVLMKEANKLGTTRKATNDKEEDFRTKKAKQGEEKTRQVEGQEESESEIDSVATSVVSAFSILDTGDNDKLIGRGIRIKKAYHKPHMRGWLGTIVGKSSKGLYLIRFGNDGASIGMKKLSFVLVKSDD